MPASRDTLRSQDRTAAGLLAEALDEMRRAAALLQAAESKLSTHLSLTPPAAVRGHKVGCSPTMKCRPSGHEPGYGRQATHTQHSGADRNGLTAAGWRSRLTGNSCGIPDPVTRCRALRTDDKKGA